MQSRLRLDAGSILETNAEQETLGGKLKRHGIGKFYLPMSIREYFTKPIRYTNLSNSYTWVETQARHHAEILVKFIFIGGFLIGIFYLISKAV